MTAAPTATARAGEHAGHDHGRAVGQRVAEEHQHDDADVEERRDRAAEHADDHQRDRAARLGRLEDGELPGESAGQRDTGEGQQEEREHARPPAVIACRARPSGTGAGPRRWGPAPG